MSTWRPEVRETAQPRKSRVPKPPKAKKSTNPNAGRRDDPPPVQAAAPESPGRKRRPKAEEAPRRSSSYATGWPEGAESREAQGCRCAEPRGRRCAKEAKTSSKATRWWRRPERFPEDRLRQEPRELIFEGIQDLRGDVPTAVLGTDPGPICLSHAVEYVGDAWEIKRLHTRTGPALDLRWWHFPVVSAVEGRQRVRVFRSERGSDVVKSQPASPKGRGGTEDVRLPPRFRPAARRGPGSPRRGCPAHRQSGLRTRGLDDRRPRWIRLRIAPS